MPGLAIAMDRNADRLDRNTQVRYLIASAAERKNVEAVEKCPDGKIVGKLKKKMNTFAQGSTIRRRARLFRP
jgi:hypothetical protein